MSENKYCDKTCGHFKTHFRKYIEEARCYKYNMRPRLKQEGNSYIKCYACRKKEKDDFEKLSSDDFKKMYGSFPVSEIKSLYKSL